MDFIKEIIGTDLKNLLSKYQNDNLMATLYITGVTATLFTFYFLNSNKTGSAKNKKSKKRKQKAVVEKPLTLEEKIDKVLQKYNTEYENSINVLLEKFDNSEKQVYEKNYFNEMLLKLLIELDGVDLIDVEDKERKTMLKMKRKDAIKLIQTQLNKLDKL